MITYRGYVNHNKAGARLVVVEEDGLVTGPLRHITKHSPDGFSWGYCGSGAAELARCLLIDALDLKPDCDQCDGEGRANCWWCYGGYVEPSPAMYQEFKDPQYGPPPLLLRMVEAGLLGKKSGKGFYSY